VLLAPEERMVVRGRTVARERTAVRGRTVVKGRTVATVWPFRRSKRGG